MKTLTNHLTSNTKSSRKFISFVLVIVMSIALFPASLPITPPILPVSAATSIADAIIEIANSPTYTGYKVFPAINVKHNGYNLLLGTDYTVAYTNNINARNSTDTNPPTITLTGIGNFSGTKSTPFTISRKAFSGTIQYEDKEIWTNNTAVPATNPDFLVKDGTKTLTLNTDYTVSIARPAEIANLGTQITATLTFIGNYSGTQTKTFTGTLETGLGAAKFQFEITTTSSKLDFTIPMWHDKLHTDTARNLRWTIDGGDDTTPYPYVNGDSTYTGTTTDKFTHTYPEANHAYII